MAPGTFRAFFNKLSPRSSISFSSIPDFQKSYASSLASTIPTESGGQTEHSSLETRRLEVEEVLKVPWRGQNLSDVAPTTSNAVKCIERWGLLAPYDTSITDAQWARYYEERSAIEDIHNPALANHYRIVAQELAQKPLYLVETARWKLGQVVSGSRLNDEEKSQMIRTITHSVYYLSLSGFGDATDCSNLLGVESIDVAPRRVAAETRLYSPFGIGTSVDFKYYYYNMRFRDGHQRSALAMAPRTIRDCSATALDCTATMIGTDPTGPPAAGSTMLFDWNGKKTVGPAIDTLVAFERAIFSCSGWLSPRLMFDLLLAGGTPIIYSEPSYHLRDLQQKFHLFVGEKEHINLEL